LKISTIFVLVSYSDSVYKTPKTHFDLLLLKTATRAEKLLSNGNSKEKREGFMSHLYSTLGCFGRGGKGKAAQRKGQRWRREKERDGKGRGGAGRKKGTGRAGHGGCFMEET
jgi:hypothetical protein